MSWGEVKKINSNLNIPLDKLIKNLNLNSGGVKIVKSVQRGISTGSANPITISISKVDPSKSVVFVNGYLDVNGEMFNNEIGKITLSSTSLVIGTTANNNRSISASFTWQVIEFY